MSTQGQRGFDELERMRRKLYRKAIQKKFLGAAGDVMFSAAGFVLEWITPAYEWFQPVSQVAGSPVARHCSRFAIDVPSTSLEETMERSMDARAAVTVLVYEKGSTASILELNDGESPPNLFSSKGEQGKRLEGEPTFDWHAGVPYS